MRTPNEIAFVKKMVAAALRIECQLNIPRGVTVGMLAQSCVETAARDGIRGYLIGASPLVVEANNPFGMQWFAKYHSDDQLPPVRKESYEILNGVRQNAIELFRHFQDLDHAFIAYWATVGAPRYQAAIAAAKACGWQGYISAIQPCGYCTNPAYVTQLAAFVREFHFDDDAQLRALATGVN